MFKFFNNPYTTIVGVLLLVSAATGVVAKMMQGDTPSFDELMEALVGLGFIKAKDGGR